jgi:hypothetical protein
MLGSVVDEVAGAVIGGQSGTQTDVYREQG